MARKVQKQNSLSLWSISPWISPAILLRKDWANQKSSKSRPEVNKLIFLAIQSEIVLVRSDRVFSARHFDSRKGPGDEVEVSVTQNVNTRKCFRSLPIDSKKIPEYEEKPEVKELQE